MTDQNESSTRDPTGGVHPYTPPGARGNGGDITAPIPKHTPQVFSSFGEIPARQITINGTVVITPMVKSHDKTKEIAGIVLLGSLLIAVIFSVLHLLGGGPLTAFIVGVGLLAAAVAIWLGQRPTNRVRQTDVVR